MHLDQQNYCGSLAGNTRTDTRSGSSSSIIDISDE